MTNETQSIPGENPEVTVTGDRKKKNSFVTVSGWVMFIYGTVSSLLNALFYALMPDLSHLIDAGDPAFEAQGIARLIDVVLHAFPYFMLYTSGFALLLAFAGVTLLQRKEWGRRLAIGLMGWMILVGIGGAVLGTLFLVEVMSGGETFTIYAFVAGGFVGLISSLAWVGLYTYVLYKLTRPEVRAEFRSGMNV